MSSTLNQQNVIIHFITQAAHNPEAIALQKGNEKVSYAVLQKKCEELQYSFQLQGLKAGHKILILHPVGINLYAAMLALLRMGCTLVFAEEWNGLRDIAACQQHMKCDAMLCSFKIRLITLLFPSLRNLKRISLQQKSLISNVLIATHKPAENLAALVSFSSGSSGTPKAVIRTHAQLNAQFMALKPHVKLNAGGRICTNFPVVILLNLGLGLHTYISAALQLSALEKTDFGAFNAEINDHQINCLACSPFVIDTLANYLLLNQQKLLNVQQILTGGSPFFPAFADHIEKAFPNAAVMVLYGSSEAEPIAFCEAHEVVKNKEKPGLFSGKTDQHTDCKIGEFQNGVFSECETNIPGEILVSGAHVVTEYYESPEAFTHNKILLDGKVWHRTGDYGYFDEKKQLFLTGNPSYSNGSEHLLNAEKKLADIPGVVRATLLKQVAFIHKQDSADEKNIEKHVRALFAQVQKVKFMKLPLDKRHHGKIKYGQLI